jgi:hypothetical protein
VAAFGGVVDVGGDDQFVGVGGLGSAGEVGGYLVRGAYGDQAGPLLDGGAFGVGPRVSGSLLG